MRGLINVSLTLLIAILLSSCGSLTQSLLFQTDESINADVFKSTLLKANQNYKIQKQDYLAISIFPNKGEQLVDPTNDFPMGEGGSNLNSNGGVGGNQLGDAPNSRLNLPITRNNLPPNSYLVNENGEVNLPKLGLVNLEGLKLYQADSLLTVKYASYVKDPYVITQYLNKRVVLMGALGERVVPLRNENVSLYEVLSLASGNAANVNLTIQRHTKANKIRLIRDYESGKPSVLVIDITTYEGMSQLNTNVQPNDIIYLEPRRKLDRESLSDISAILSPITSVIALFVAISALSR